MAGVLGGQTGDQERDLGSLGEALEPDEGSGGVGLERLGGAEEGRAAVWGGEGEVAAWCGEVADALAELLRGADAEAVLLADTLQVGDVVCGGAVLRRVEEGLVGCDRGVVLLDHVFERPGVLDDLDVARLGGAVAVVEGRGGGRARQQQAAQCREDMHGERQKVSGV